MSQHLVSLINRGQSRHLHEMIKNIGGFDSQNALWKMPQSVAISAIEAGKYEFFMLINGKAYDLVVAERSGQKYLKTTRDEREPSTLLKLPECP